ncbi:uncharacterized protein mslnb isoform X2 [Paramisgurnus dabryanus]|uniref:uncharacterized protein mslnb isoform X2 n=1 Tax=Paramisgurnus dabryanus TaxID=90735 RepID=UPI003CCF44EE
MGSSIIFLLLYAGLIGLGGVKSAEQNQTCGTGAGITSGQCTHMSNSTQNFLSCAGVPSDLEADHVLNLKGLISAALDVYTFMRSSVSGVPVLDLSGGVALDEDHVIKAWLDVRLTPLLSSISRNFLTCLSNRNFSCNAYQTVVRELSQHFSHLDPVKQKWIYSFFMYPFLSRNTSSGCVDPEASSEDWLMKNFGSFSVMAQVRDFTSINMLFSGLEVLHLLTREQKAELLLYPEMVGLTDSSLSLVFQSLLSSLQSSENHQPSDNGTMFYMRNGPSASMQDPLRQALNGFMTAFRPVGSFVHNFVSLTQQQNLYGMRSATLMQAVINLTLAEIAAPFKQQNLTDELQDEFDPTDIDDWFTYVVSPMLRRFLPGDLAEIPSNLTAVFHNQFYIETGMGSQVPNESQDICSVSIDDRTCALTDLVEHVSTILNCAARSNFTLTEETLLEVLLHLSQNLNALLQQLSMTNFSSQSPYFGDILNQIEDTFTTQSLQDESFVRLWFQVKLKPLLSTLTPEYLTCLSHKEFSCQTFQLLVSELSDNMFMMSGEGPQDVYRYFIFSYLSLKNASGGCPTENSSVWVTQNLGGFSHFAMLMEMYQLKPDFNAIDAIPVLSPNQLAELIVEDFPRLPEKSIIINLVFDYILISPEERGLFMMLEHLIMLADEMGLECSSYQLIVQRLEESLLLHYMMEPVQDNIDLLKKMASPGCFPPPFTCISTPVNETSICSGVNGDELNALLSAGFMSVSCNISLDQYACSPLNDFTAVNLADLLKCQLSSNISSSKEIWKLLLTKTNEVLDQALIIFSSMAENMTQPIRSESLSHVLDVIAELRLEQLSPDQWNVWFNESLKAFLPYASSSLLQCMISKNLSCQTYQQLLQAFNIQFHLMDEMQRSNMVEFFILPFLRRNTTDQGCVSSSNSSTEWLQMNFGLFVQFVSLRDLLFIDPLLNPLETLDYLSADQMVELMVDDLPELTEKDLIINEVFDYLLESPVERGLPDVLQILLIRSQTTIIPCSSYLLIFEKLFNASSSLPSYVETLVLQITKELKQNGAKDCNLPQPPTCISTLVNATRVCEGVNSDELNALLSAGFMSVSCNISLNQYACSPLNDFTAVNLADLLKCQLSSNISSSKEIWKLLFTKTNEVLDQALIIFSSMAENMTQPIRSESLSHVLDVIAELRLEQLSPDQWNVWFNESLKAFLPYASSSLLQCMISKNLSCQTYQQLLQSFNIQFHLMDEMQRSNMVEFFILPFLRRNTTDQGCVSSSNSSTEWLQMNFGLFVQFVSLRDLLFIDPLLNPLETLDYLSADQMVELMVDDLPELTEKDLIINEVFDYLLESPVERGLPDVLEILLIRSQTTIIPCSSYLLIFEKLFNASSSLPSYVETLVLQITKELKQNGAKDCNLPQPPTCISTLVNATRVCEGVNGDELNALLSAGFMSVSCNISLDQYACSPLNDFTAVNLADLLKCQLSSNISSSKEIWKLLFTKTNEVLDQALIIFSSMAENMTQPIRSESLSHVLDVIAELRLEQLSPDQWNVWFNESLKAFLPYASSSLLQCMISKNLSCQTYQQLLQSFNIQFHLMDEMQRSNMVEFFILPFLRRNTTDQGCVSSSNSSTEWLQMNFGLFVQFVSLRDLLFIDPLLNPLETLDYLSADQMVELMVDDLPELTEKDLIINEVFDYLLESPVERGLPDVLQILLIRSQTTIIPCSSYLLIFEKLFNASSSLPSYVETLVLQITKELKQNGAKDCNLPQPPTCISTLVNATRVCEGVNSDELNALLSAGFMSVSCNISLDQYACSPLNDFTAVNLADLLKCQLSSNISSSKEIWKLLFTKTNEVLDQALIIFSSMAENVTQPIRSESLSHVLDVIAELRLEQLSPDQWNVWFNKSLKAFLPYASSSLLQCMISKNLSCQTYQQLLQAFNIQFHLMDEMQRSNMVEFFILPFLRRNTTDQGCVSSSNSSTEWLQMNFGLFVQFVSLRDLLFIDPLLNPLETLDYLSADQMVELMVDDLPELTEKDLIINEVFDYLLESPVERGLPDVLQILLIRSQTTIIPCSSYLLIFEKLFNASSSLPSYVETLVLQITKELKQNGAKDCNLPQPPTCISTLVNATRVCEGVNGDELNALLSAGFMSVSCNISLDQYACSPLNDFTAVNLADLLKCQLSSNISSSKEIWKLLFTKTNEVLDQALIIFSSMAENMTQPIRSESLSHVLDVIAELRLEQLSPDQWNVWFNESLKAFLPYASSSLLQCMISKNLSCQTYQQLLQSFNIQFHLMDEMQRSNMVEFFILPFLRRNTTDQGCVSSSNSSTEWLQMNFGLFVQFVSLRDLLFIDPLLNPLETLDYLSADQMVELMVDDLPELTEKDLIINEVFDYLLESPVERGLPDVLQILLIRSQTTIIPCSSYLLIFEKLFNASSSLPSYVETLVLQITKELKQNGAKDCNLPQPPTCISTLVNATRVCEGVNSDELNALLSAGFMSVSCNISLDQYACSPLNDFTAVNLADLLKCQLSSNISSSKEIWKLLFTKTNEVLDQALIIFSSMAENMTQPIRSESLSHVLDVIAELRLEQLSPDQWNVWFNKSLKAFLPYASSSLLQCMISKNLSCQTYQQLLQAFNIQFHLMDEMQRSNMVEFFILPFLRRNTTDQGCVSSSNSSTEWLQMNFGLFVQFVSLRDLLFIDPLLNPLETLDYLSADQMVELMVDDLPELTEKDLIINEVFDYLLESPVERGLPDVLQILLIRSQTTIIPCSSYLLIFEKLFNASSSLPSYVETLVLHITKELKQNGAKDCNLPQPPTCISTLVNATRVCEGVNSDELNALLSAGFMSVSCNISLDQYACSPLNDFTAVNLADLLKCQLSSNISSSKEIWKLLFTKTNEVLDQALIIFSSMAENMTQPIRSESLSHVLDVIAELRLEQLSPDQWNVWFNKSLKAFLPYASSSLLQCMISKNLSCQTYQQLLQSFNIQFHLMDEMQRSNMVEFFILPFLRRNTTDQGCVSSSNSSTEWLQMNFGLFVQFVSLRDLLFIDPLLNPLETLDYLSADQMVELMVDDLPELTEKDLIINEVFDYLLESPVERGLPDVLQILLIRSQTNPLSCQSNQIIFMKLEQILRRSAGDLEPMIWMSLYNFNSTAPADCSLLPVLNECQLIPYNVTQVCSGVDSSSLQQYLNNANTTQTFCDFSIGEYACTPMLSISVKDLVSILDCQRSEDVMSSPETWKLFLIKVSHLLDSALYTIYNTSMWWSDPSGTVILDVLRELRLDGLTDDGVIATWLNGRLRPFLPVASGAFLQCLSHKNFSCQNFQTIVAAFDAGFDHMDELQRQTTLTEFILPLITRQTADVACPSNDSARWLISNFGQFSTLLTLNQLIALNPQLNLLEILDYLSPEQLAGLIVDDVPEKVVVINQVFIHLAGSPEKIPDVLFFLVEMSKMNNISCVSYQAIFHRLDHLLVSVSVDLETIILRSRSALLQNVPRGCMSYSGACDITPVNETAACSNVTSSALLAYLNSPHNGSQLCDFSITQYSCTELTDLSSQDLATVLLCSFHGNENVSDETWKLFVQKVNPVMGPALDRLSDTMLNKSRLSVSFLNMIGEVTLSTFGSSSFQDDLFVQRWFNSRLRPFLPHSSEAFLSCLSTKNFSCDTFRTVVNSFSQSYDLMSKNTQANVYVDFIKIFLSLNSTKGCVDGTESSSDWLMMNFGAFNVFTTINDLQTINPSFNVWDTLSLLSIRQLVEVSITPGLLSTSAEANQLLSIIPDNQLTTYYTSLSTALQVEGVSLSPPVQEVFLQQVFDRANLTTVSDAELQVWILDILPPFITNITAQHVTAYFSVLQGRPCNISQQGVQLLSSSISTFQSATQDQIYQQILNSLQGSTPLRCYGNQSFFSFLQSSFMSFQFPNLSTFLSLMPPGRVPELMDSISPAEINTLLSRPGAVDDLTKVCQLLSSYPKTPQYLETEPVLSVVLGRQMLSCVWSQVLRIVNRSEVDQWFDHRLVQYLPFLTSQLIAPNVMRDSSCVSFSKFVSVMGKYNYSAVDFSPRDIYSTIEVYLNTTSTPKCYNASQPDLNSTAWFANYIGTFMSFITLDDLTLLFGSSQLQPFTVNLENLQLLNSVNIPDNVTEFYVTLLFQENPNFNAFNLPAKFRCLAPVSSFRHLTMEQLDIVSPSIHQNCKNIQPDVSAALASNAQVLTLDSIQALGQSCTGLSLAQLSSAGPQVLLSALSVFSTVIGWNQDQAMTIIQILLSSNLYQINSASSLQGLGSLIIGVSSSSINLMSSSEVLTSVQSASFVTNAITSPVIVQQTIVNQIIAVNTSPDVIVANVPDLMATEIPRIFLIDLSPAVAQTINHKKWKQEQAILLFETVAMKISDPDSISFQVLQGFTCTRVQSFTTLQINNLIHGCRRRGNETVVLQESQLTCMYYYIKSADPSAFSQYPAETLLYYDYSLVQTSLCSSYFSALGKADFSVLSSTLSFKKQTLFSNAKGCLGISGFYISRVQLDVLGNMCCILSADYIVNSDPYVLEKLKDCPDLSDEQTSAIETLLLTGKTSYGPSDTWNRTTLDNLGSLSLYFTSNIWGKFTQPIKQQFQKTFIRGLRKKDKDLEKKLIKMMKESSKSSRAKRATDCTVGQITQVEVYSNLFPFDYDVTQFNVCLSVQTVKYNLEAITDKVYDPQYQRIVLDKLNQAYPGGLSDEVLQVLGPTSRVATASDITSWNVTKVDTLASLMNSRNGDWEPVLAALIVSKYLSVKGNSLGIAELNSLGSNVCALDTNVLNSIATVSVERATALALTNCTLEKKKIMFSIAQTAFSPTNRRGADRISLTTYQLMQSYLGGANTAFVYKLVNSDVNMDVPTFMGLDQSVINVLNVTDVKNLLGVNVGDLKTYESASQIQEWIRLQLQSDLDTLKIGLKGGRNATVTTAKPSVSISTTKGKVTGANTVATTGAGFRVWPPVCLQLLLLAVTMMLLH